MAYGVGNVVTLEDLLQQFIIKVSNAAISITNGVKAINHSGNPTGNPIDNYLDSLTSLQIYPSQGIGKQRFGSSMDVIKSGTPGTSSYGSIYAAITHLTKMLLKLGGWTYRDACRGAYDNTTTGTAVFNTGTVLRAFGAIDIDAIPLSLDPGIISPLAPITLISMESMFNNALSKWQGISKPCVKIVNITCHVDCHDDHSNECHTNGIDPAFCNEWMNPFKPYVVISHGCNTCNCYVNGDHVYGKAEGTHQNIAGGGHSNESGNGGGCHTNTTEIYLGAYPVNVDDSDDEDDDDE